MTVSVDDGHLSVRTTGGTALTLLAESEARFFIREADLAVEFVRDSTGTVTESVMLQGTRQEHATRLK